jgi:DNA uptake protein ComE-like DNA-binding protein
MSSVDINTASVYELERTFHNRERAQEILNKREQFGDFRDWEDLRDKVHGISDRLIRELSDAGVIVGGHGHS